MRRFFRIVGIVVLCILGSVALVVAVAYSMGTVTVSVHEKKPDGQHVYVPVPAVMIPLGMRLAPSDDIAEAVATVRLWLPAIKVASEELVRCPDSNLVEVTSAEQRVRIAKRGGSIVIDVDSPEERVYVSVPLETVYLVASQFEGIDERLARSAKPVPTTPGTDHETSN